MRKLGTRRNWFCLFGGMYIAYKFLASFKKDLIRRSWALRVLSSTRTRSCSQGGFPTSVTCSVDSPICVALKVPSMKPEQAVGQHLAQNEILAFVWMRHMLPNGWWQSLVWIVWSSSWAAILMQDRPHSFPKDSSGAWNMSWHIANASNEKIWWMSLSWITQWFDKVHGWQDNATIREVVGFSRTQRNSFRL